MKTLVFICLLLSSFVSSLARAERSIYADQKKSAIKALTPDDYQFLKEGSGMALSGMAKAAELNAYPGPKHILELEKELKLSSTQKDLIKKIYTNMHTRAKALGANYLDVEKKLDDAFRQGRITSKMLSQLVEDSSKLYGALRLAHLEAHLESKAILSKKQLASYNELRGYENSCGKVPEGHDPKMWRKHHGCVN